MNVFRIELEKIVIGKETLRIYLEKHVILVQNKVKPCMDFLFFQKKSECIRYIAGTITC